MILCGLSVQFHRKYKQLFFFILGGIISICSYSFWRRSNYFLSSWRVTVFDPGGINIFLFMQFSPLCGLSCLHFCQDGQIQPFWKVRCLEQYTSWKVRVPETVFLWEIWTPTFTHTHTHTQLCTHTFMNIHVQKQVRLRGWVVGCVVGWCGVVWCGAVCCCRGVLVLGILKLEIGKIKGLLLVNLWSTW